MRVAENADLLPALLAASPIGAAIASADARLLLVNSALGTLLGVPQESLPGTPLWQYIHPEHLSSCQAAISALLQGTIPRCDLTLRIVRHDGQEVWTQLTGTYLPETDKTPGRLILYLRQAAQATDTDKHHPFPLHDPQQILDRITDGVVALDRDWRIVFVNQAAAPIFGLSFDALQALVGRNIQEVYPQMVGTPAHVAAETAFRTGTATSAEYYSPQRGAWISVHVYPSVDGLSVLMRDVTQARELEAALRTSEERLRFFLDNVPAVIYSVSHDSATSRVFLGPHHEELSGYSAAEAQELANDWIELVHPDDIARVAAENARAEATGDRFIAEYRLRRKDGEYIWVHDECVPVRDDNGEIVAWQGVMLDITDRVKAQAAQAHLAALVASAEDAVVSTDLSGIITSWNLGAEKLYGYRADEMVGHSFARLLPPDIDADSMMQRGAQVYTGETLEPFESRRVRKDGSVINVSMTMSPIRDENGLIVGISSITRDITERKRLEQELRDALVEAHAASLTKSQFLAMMSHELHTPVQAVLGFSELLLLEHENALTPEQREDVITIRESARSLTQLIAHLLDLSRMDAGRFSLSTRPVAIEAILDEVRQEVLSLSEAKGLTLEFDSPPTLPPALGDPDRVHQVIHILVENAVKFTEHGGVTVRAREAAPGLEIEVRDTGIGIPEEALLTIFEAFRQVDTKLSRRYGGAGLGLAIAQRLAQHMGGRITVSSVEGQGSTFTLELPTAPVPSATPGH